MNLESRVAALESTIGKRPDESAEKMRALCAAVRNRADIVQLVRAEVMASNQGRHADAVSIKRKYLVKVYPLALEYLGAEAAEPFAPPCV